MERIGVRIDTAALEKAGREMEKELDAADGRDLQLAGQEFNINSTISLARYSRSSISRLAARPRPGAYRHL